MSVFDSVTLDGWSQVAISYEFDIADSEQNIIGSAEVSRENNVTIENNINRDIKRQLNNLTLRPDIAQDINPLRDRIVANMVLQDRSRWPLGTFLFSDMSYERTSVDRGTRHATMLDQAILLDQPCNRPVSFKPGVTIQNAITLLMGFFPYIPFEIEPSTAVIGGKEAVAWPPGTHYLAMINDLCGLGSYYSLYFDNSGVARVILVPDLEDVEPTLLYGSTPGQQRVFRNTVVETDDQLTAPNRYIVINNQLNNDKIVGFWDIPSSAPHSIQNRDGQIIAVVVDKQGVDTIAEATAAAKAYGQADYNTYQWITFDAAPDPRHDTFDVMSWESVKYREQSWRLECRAEGSMTHEGRRVYVEVLS